MIGETFTRKSEIYADSFAAAYDYGPELTTALEKLDRYATRGPLDDNGSVLAPFYSLANLDQELMAAFEGHGTTQMRIKRINAALDYNLEHCDLTPSQKSELLAEQKRLNRVYDRYVNAPPAVRDRAAAAFRRILDNWYNGKNYSSRVLMPDQTYAM